MSLPELVAIVVLEPTHEPLVGQEYAAHIARSLFHAALCALAGESVFLEELSRERQVGMTSKAPIGM